LPQKLQRDHDVTGGLASAFRSLVPAPESYMVCSQLQITKLGRRRRLTVISRHRISSTPKLLNGRDSFSWSILQPAFLQLIANAR
jgi:hypothetical protein